MKIPQGFETENCNDLFRTCLLWKHDGSAMACIGIMKRVFVANSNRIVFSVYDHINRSKNSPRTGGIVNKKPFTSLKRALSVALKHEAKARATGQWVDAKDAKVPANIPLVTVA